MSNVYDEIDKILKEVAESAWSLGLQTAPKDNLYNDRNNRMTPYKAKQAITTLLEQSEAKVAKKYIKLIKDMPLFKEAVNDIDMNWVVLEETVLKAEVAWNELMEKRLEQREREARIDEWKLISEVQHSAGITAELYFGKERDERINQLTNKGNK